MGVEPVEVDWRDMKLLVPKLATLVTFSGVLVKSIRTSVMIVFMLLSHLPALGRRHRYLEAVYARRARPACWSIRERRRIRPNHSVSQRLCLLLQTSLQVQLKGTTLCLSKQGYVVICKA
jgi:hypothetical protein